MGCYLLFVLCYPLSRIRDLLFIPHLLLLLCSFPCSPRCVLLLRFVSSPLPSTNQSTKSSNPRNPTPITSNHQPPSYFQEKGDIPIPSPLLCPSPSQTPAPIRRHTATSEACLPPISISSYSRSRSSRGPRTRTRNVLVPSAQHKN